MEGLVKEVRDSGDAVVVVAMGEVTLDRSPALHKALLEVCARKPEHLVVEMSEVSHIDSAGVGTLVEIFRRVRSADGKMSLAGMNARVRSVFEVTRLDQFFTIYATEEDALNG